MAFATNDLCADVEDCDWENLVETTKVYVEACKAKGNTLYAQMPQLTHLQQFAHCFLSPLDDPNNNHENVLAWGKRNMAGEDEEEESEEDTAAGAHSESWEGSDDDNDFGHKWQGGQGVARMGPSKAEFDALVDADRKRKRELEQQAVGMARLEKQVADQAHMLAELCKHVFHTNSGSGSDGSPISPPVSITGRHTTATPLMGGLGLGSPGPLSVRQPMGRATLLTAPKGPPAADPVPLQPLSPGAPGRRAGQRCDTTHTRRRNH